MAITPNLQPQRVGDLDLTRVHHLGVNTVGIDVWWDVDGATQSHVTPGANTTSDTDLELSIQGARALGLRVMLTPHVWCPSCLALGKSDWAGKLEPTDRAEFFREYRSMIDHYATIAGQTGVWLFVIGHEMGTLQGETAQWRTVAHSVRPLLHGPIAYGMDWQTMAGYAPMPAYWDAVDVVGISAYFPLSDAARPSVGDLKAAWKASQDRRFLFQPWVSKLAALAQATRKPILFAEVGYLSSTYAGKEPFNPNAAYQSDQQVQANLYQALLETFEPQPWWMGVVWWSWDLNDPGQTGYTPRTKLAEQLLIRWYRQAWRPASTG